MEKVEESNLILSLKRRGELERREAKTFFRGIYCVRSINSCKTKV